MERRTENATDAQKNRAVDAENVSERLNKLYKIAANSGSTGAFKEAEWRIVAEEAIAALAAIPTSKPDVAGLGENECVEVMSRAIWAENTTVCLNRTIKREPGTMLPDAHTAPLSQPMPCWRRSKKMRIERMTEGKNGWTYWINPICKPVYRMVCCDCGLSHDMQFKIKQGKIIFRAKRNNRSTAAMRRKDK